MKRTISKLLGIAVLATAGIAGSLIAVTPAQATVQTCVPYPTTPTTTYPLDGHMFKCFPTARNGAETSLQNQMANSVNAGVARLSNAEKALLKANNVRIYVFYNGDDGLQTLGDPIAVKDGETARTYPWTNTTPQGPKTAIWAYTPAQWTALAGAIPTTYNGGQMTGTAAHEMGHQMDRQWAANNGYTPTVTAIISTNTTVNPIQAQAFITAVNWDGYRLSSLDIAYLKLFFPRYVETVNNVDKLKRDELFAEMFAKVNGGGAGGLTGTEDTWLGVHFPCSQWVVTYLHTDPHNGAPPPATPNGSICYSHTSWSEPAP